MTLRRKLSVGIAGSSLAVMLAITPAAAQVGTNVEQVNVTRGGAAGLVAAVVQATDLVDVTDSTIDIAVVELNNSLNNLRALNNVLNNSPILSNNDVIDDVTIQNIDVLTDFQIDILRNANIALDDVIGVAVLSGGDFVVFTQSQ